MSKVKARERWDRLGDNPLVIVSELRKQINGPYKWAEEVDDLLQDDDVVEVLNRVIQLMSGQHPDHDKIAPLLVKLEAWNIKFRLMYSQYMGPKKGTTEASAKKNHYIELYHGIDRLVDSLKYLIK